MKTIQLTQGQVAIVDDDDFDMVNAFKWCSLWNPDTRTFYAVRNSPAVNGKRGMIYMHREVTNSKAGEYVDHINHDTLDNRHENLRLCTGGQNQANHRMQVNNTSGFKGVSWYKVLGKWEAKLMVNGKTRHLGYFTTALTAAIAYDRAARDEFGEFALTNQMLGLIPENKEEQ